MTIAIVAILAVVILLFIITIAIYIAIEGALLEGIVILIIIIGTLLMANFLWRGK